MSDAAQEFTEAVANNGHEPAAEAAKRVYSASITLGATKMSNIAWKVGWGLVSVGIATDFALIAGRQFQKAWKQR